MGMGSLAEFVVVPESSAALKPANLDFVQAASVPMVGLTSWQALEERMQLKPGQRVFIPAGSGGKGTFAIQLAKYLGAKVGTTVSTGNQELVRSLGADEIIDYKQQQFEDVHRDYDVVLGTVKGDTIEKSLQILKPGSSIVSLVGPPDAAFARARGMNFVMRFVFGLLSRKSRCPDNLTSTGGTTVTKNHLAGRMRALTRRIRHQTLGRFKYPISMRCLVKRSCAV
jgi:NADPH:quinone reductase-like Zn-dependent oxidoreductase